jgi:hypothetical protein
MELSSLSLPGPSRIITVEPIEVPAAPEPVVVPEAPDVEPTPEPVAPDAVPAA